METSFSLSSEPEHISKSIQTRMQTQHMCFSLRSTENRIPMWTLHQQRKRLQHNHSSKQPEPPCKWMERNDFYLHFSPGRLNSQRLKQTPVPITGQNLELLGLLGKVCSSGKVLGWWNAIKELISYSNRPM